MEETKGTEGCLSNETLECVTWMLGYLPEKIKLIENATNTKYDLCKSLVAKLRRMKNNLVLDDNTNSLVLNNILSELEGINNCLSVIMLENAKSMNNKTVISD